MLAQRLLIYFYILWFVIAPIYFHDGFTVLTLLYVILYATPGLLALYLCCVIFSRKRNNWDIPIPLVTGLSLILNLIFLVMYYSYFDGDVQITREVALTRGQRFVGNIPILSFLLLTLNFYAKWTNLYKLSLVISLLLSVYIGYEMGRRTSALLPILILSIMWFDKHEFNGISKVFFLLKIIFCGSVTIALVTISRSQPQSILELTNQVFSRIFNTGKMSLSIIAHDGEHLNHSFLNFALNKIKSDWISTDAYYGIGNSFGRWYSFIPETNFVVGINPGIMAEIYASMGLGGIFATVIIFPYMFWVVSFAEKARRGLGLLAAILFGHAMQMEIGYMLGLSVRILVLSSLFYFLKFVLAPYSRSTYA